MHRFVKITLALVGVVVLIVAGTALGAHYLVSKQDSQFLRQKIEERTHAATGFKLQVRGPLELPYSLMPTVVLRDIVVDNPDYPGETNLLEAGELRIRFAVIPLLRGEVLIYESSLSDVHIRLEVSEDGDENWITADQSGTEVGLPAQLAVHTIDSHQMTVSYANLETGTEFTSNIDDINLRAPRFNDQIQIRMRAEFSGTPIEVNGRLGSTEDILAGNAFPIDVDIDIHDVDIDLSGRVDRIEDGEFSDLLLHLDLQGSDLRDLQGMAGQVLPETKQFSASTTLSLEGNAIVLSNLFAEFAWLDSAVELAGDIKNIETLSGIDVAMAVSGSNATDISAVHEFSWLPVTDAYDLAGTVRGSWPSLEATDVHLHTVRNDVVVDAAGAVMDLDHLGGVDLEVSVRGGDLGRWSALTGIALPQSQTYQLGGRVNGSWPTLSLSAASATLERGGLRLELSGQITDLNELSGLDIGILANGENLSEIPELSDFDLPDTNSFDIDARLTGNSEALSALINTAKASRGSHTMTLSGEVAGLLDIRGLKLKLEVRGDNLAELNGIFGLKVPPTHKYRMSVDLAGDADEIAASNVSVIGEMPGARLNIRGSVGRIADLQNIDLDIKAATEDLSSLNRYMSFRLPVSEAVDVSGQLRGSAPNLRLDEFTIVSGETHINGSVGVGMGERPSIKGSVSSGILDLRPYFIAARDDAKEKIASREDRVFPAAIIDLSFLDHIDARVKLDNLWLWSSAGNVRVEQAIVELRDGSLSVLPFRVTREDATLEGRFQLNRQGLPHYELDMTVERMNLATFLEDIRVQEVYEGRFDLALEIAGSGTSIREIAASLNGNVAAFVSEARVPQVSTALRTVDVLFELFPWVTRRKDIMVNCAISQVEIEQGRATVKLLYLDGAQLTMVGGGTLDLQNERLNLRFAPRPKKRKFLAHNIDLTMKGSLANPIIATAGATRALATTYGKYALLGPYGLLVPTSRSKTHPCVGSLQEFRDERTEAE